MTPGENIQRWGWWVDPETGKPAIVKSAHGDYVLASEQWEIREGDCLDLLRAMESGSVQTCVTSPPYWGLRDYGQDRQLGLEPTPAEFVANLVAVFAEVRRALADDGTLWLNLGDSYAAQRGGSHQPAETLAGGTGGFMADGTTVNNPSRNASAIGLKHKDLVGIPWRVAFALQADGWYLRSDIIWAKPNPMPESVTDRPTKAHEYLFLLSKSPRYFYDADAVKERAIATNPGEIDGGAQREADGSKANDGRNYRAPRFGREKYGDNGASQHRTKSGKPYEFTGYRNKRTVWTVPSQPFKGAHFATFPPKLIEPCILAGSKTGDTVLDPFSGSGTTGMVALRHNRSYIGLELSPEYVAMSRDRIRNDAPLLNTGIEVA